MTVDPEGGPHHDKLELSVGPAGSSPTPLGTLLQGTSPFLWTRQDRTSTRIELSPFGIAQVQFINESDETIFEGWIDTHNVLRGFRTPEDA